MSRKWYLEKIDNLFEIFGSASNGLSLKQVQINRKKYGENVLSTTKKVTLISIFVSQFKSAFIYILLLAAVIIFLLGEYIDGIIIVSIILLNATIGTLQEGKARDTLEALKKEVKSKATVLRSGEKIIIYDYEIVPGDILILKDGDKVSADARIMECNSLKVNEASITGESNSVLKNHDEINNDNVDIADRLNMVFKGTYVISGLAQAIVVGTGSDTSIGKVAKKLDQLHSDVPLKDNINNLSKLIIAVVSLTSILLFLVGIFTGYSITEMFLTVVAIAVSAIPESLPVVVTLVLATGVWRMSKKNVLVKRLQAVEALGQAKVIALDKTGTITRNQMTVEKLFISGKYYIVSGDGYNPKGDVFLNNEKINPLTNDDIEIAGKISVFTSIADIVFSKEKEEWDRVSGDPTEAALIVFGEKIGLSKIELEKQYPKVSEIPFDLHNKHHTTVNIIDSNPVLSTAGSPEVIMEHCNTIWENGKIIPLTPSKKTELQNAINKLSSDGYRILALAASFNPPEKIDPTNLPNLTFVGFTGIIDAIRSEVKQAVFNSQRAGMRVVMITGDHAKTATTIANKVGIFRDGDSVLTGAEIRDLNWKELSEKLNSTTVFARVSPEDKLKIIEAYKKKGEVVAMTGDGINDALSLVAADLGVSMGKIGTEVAKEASDIILLDDNFGNIIEAVEEGRSIYQTIRKSVLYLLSTNVGELLVIVIAVFVGLPLPLLATQIIWLNMVTDTFLVAALAVEPKEKGLLGERFRKPSKWIIDKLMAFRIILIGGVMTVGTLGLFVYFLPQGLTKAWTVSLTTLTVFQWYNIFNVRSHKDSIFKQNIFSNKYLAGGLLLVIVLHMVAIYTPFMQKILHTTGLNIKEWIIILLVSISIVFVEEIRKVFYRSYLNRKNLN